MQAQLLQLHSETPVSQPKEFSEDLDLARRAHAGDRAAFSRLYHDHLGHVYAVCYRMLANAHEAKDLTQETVVRAWKMLASYKGESPISAWIHRIAIHAVLDHLRSKKRLTGLMEFTDDPESFERGEVSSGHATLDLERAVASLPTQARAVLVLHDIEGYTHEEIATMMGIVPGTSKAQLHRARRLLREVLTK